MDISNRLGFGIIAFSCVTFGLISNNLSKSADKDAARDAAQEAIIKADSDRPIVGEVLSEAYHPAVSGRPNINSQYILKIKTDYGKTIALSIFDGINKDGSEVTKESLDLLISSGTRISFPRGNYGSFLDSNAYSTKFDKDTQIGEKPASVIKILN